MATLEQLAGLNGNTDPTTDDDLRAKVQKAMIIIAKEVQDEDPGTGSHAGRLALAKAIYTNPQSYGQPFMNAMVAANASATLAQILAADDDSIKTAVRNVWNTFITE